MNVNNFAFYTLLLMFLTCTQTEMKRSTHFKGLPASEYLITPETDSLLIQWKESAPLSDSVAHYLLLYRTVSDTLWHTLKKVNKSQVPTSIITRSDINSNDSLFYIGVCNVAINGKMSDIHSTKDSLALIKNVLINWSIRYR